MCASFGGATAAAAAASSDRKEGDAEEDENIKTRDLLSLDYIRSTLIRQEETIIFALIERAQFRYVMRITCTPRLRNVCGVGRFGLSFKLTQAEGSCGSVRGNKYKEQT